MRNGYCSNGEECLYLHVDPLSKLPPCPHYDMGFCPLGPLCAKKHVRRKVCVYYLAGFCPDGPECKMGSHPKWSKDLEKPVPKSAEKSEDEVKPDMRQMFGGDDDGDRFRDGGEGGEGGSRAWETWKGRRGEMERRRGGGGGIGVGAIERMLNGGV
ncbi:uncharacterized protein TrAtP1_005990 [Trichoderma atroviride]|uniref:uncharacterized protein n=1 Tax=Hypocrea atroviridis TaxID=63577 RepID=UPI003326C031|nr:hypothetical protein TrAtP1_005990 [Trichoderma atroviride]